MSVLSVSLSVSVYLSVSLTYIIINSWTGNKDVPNLAITTKSKKKIL